MANITTIIRVYSTTLALGNVNNNVLCIYLRFSKHFLFYFVFIFCFDHKISKLLNNYLKSTLWVRAQKSIA